MAKSKAQKAAKKARKAAKKSLIVAMRPPKTPLLRNPVSKKALKRMMGAGGPGLPQAQSSSGGLNKIVSDGLSSSRVTTNLSVVEDRFKIRREKVADITGSTSSFSLQQALYINPGNSVLFPIFSQIAAPYEQYRVNFLRFVFETEAYAASGSNQTAGIACLATNFDPDDSTFSSLTQMENYYGATKGPPYACVMVHDVIRSHRGRRGGGRDSRSGDLPLRDYYVYSSGNASAPSNSTSKFYDIGQFQLAVANMVGTGIIGELYVEYSFTMIHPKQQTPLGQNLLAAHIVESPATTAAASGSAFLGTTGGVLRAGSTLPSVATKSTFTLPVAGVFLVAASWNVGVTVAPVISYGSSITGLAYLADNSAISNAAAQSGITAYLAMVSVASAGTGAANTATISVLTNLAAGTADIFIVQIPGGLLKPRLPASGDFDRVAVLETQVQRLMGLLSPPRSASCVTVEEAEEEAKLLGGKSAALPGDELGNSVHIPRGLLTQFMGALSK